MMKPKKQIISCVLILLSLQAFSQWTTLNSGTLNRLNDIDFIDESYGIVVGDSGYVNKTINGGAAWMSVSPSEKYSYTSVILKSADTIWISGQDVLNNITAVFVSYNAGTSWDTIYSYEVAENSNLYFHNGVLYLAGNFIGLYKTNDLGLIWQQIYSGGGTTLYDKAEFINNSGIYYGNHAGFATYSWGFNRTANLNDLWYPNGPYGQVTEAVSEMFALGSNEVYMFSNIFQQWFPSNTSRFVKLTAFNLEYVSVPDSQWVFSYQLINGQIDEFVNDCYFENNLFGYAVGTHGKVIKTTDGGLNWTTEYTSVSEMNALEIIGHSAGYAVGSYGVIIKLTDPSGIINNEMMFKSGLQIFPNPVSDKLNIESTEKINKLSLYSVTGTLINEVNVDNSELHNFSFDLQNILSGIYFLKVYSESGLQIKKISIR